MGAWEPGNEAGGCVGACGNVSCDSSLSNGHLGIIRHMTKSVLPSVNTQTFPMTCSS